MINMVNKNSKKDILIKGNLKEDIDLEEIQKKSLKNSSEQIIPLLKFLVFNIL